MSQTAGHADVKDGPGARLGLAAGQVVQEIGWDEDADDALRAAIEDITGTELVDDEHGDVVDAIILWWREGDGDLVDALVDALTDLAEGGAIWLLTPKVGRPGQAEPSEVADAATTAGLATTTTLPVAADWTGTKLTTRSARASRR